MLNITDETKTAYLKDSVHKELTVTFPNANITYHNDDLVVESFELTECIEASESLSFQGCISSQMKFTCSSPVRDLRSEYVEVSILANGTSESIPLFTGYIDEQTNRTQEDVVTEFTAYDKLYTIGQKDVTSWYNGLSFPISIRNFRNSFFTYVGITQEDITLINDSLNLNKIDTKDQILALDVMKAICQANARFGQLGRDGKFYYRKLTEITRGLYPSTQTFPSEETFPSDENAGITYNASDYIKVTYEPFKTEKITSVLIVDRDGTKTSYGIGTNVLAIADNIVAQACTNKSLMAQSIYEEIFRIEYIPSTVSAKGVPWLECGDIYMFNTRKNIVRSYVLHRVLKGIQALYDDITANGSQLREAYNESNYTQSTTREKDIQENNKLVVNEIQARVASIDTLRAQMIQADTINANNISALRGDFNTLSAREANFETATINSLNSTNASINYLASIAITTQNLSAQNISAYQITTGTLSVNRMDVNTLATASFAGLTMKVGAIDIGASHIGGCKLSGATATVETTGGHTVKVPLCV